MAFSEEAQRQIETATLDDIRFRIKCCYNCRHWDFLGNQVARVPWARWCKLYPLRACEFMACCHDYDGPATESNLKYEEMDWPNNWEE